MQQAIDYHNQLVALEKQGAPIDWARAAQVMANMLSAEIAKPVADSDA